VPVVVIGPPVKVMPLTFPEVAIFDTVPEPVATVIGKVVPLPFVKVIVFKDTDAVIMSLATYEAVDANELDIAEVAKDAVVANDELSALDAKDAVPNNDPVNELAQTFPLIVKEADVGVIVPIPSLLPEPYNVGPLLPNFIAPSVTVCIP
jgi:hypothetical protein